MSNTILNTALGNKLEERLNSLVNNHLKIREGHENDSSFKEKMSKTASFLMDASGPILSIGGFVVGGVGVMVANQYGQDAGMQLSALAASSAAFVGAYVGLGMLYDNIKDKINDKLGITSPEKTLRNFAKIQDDFGVQFCEDDFIKIANSLDSKSVGQDIKNAVSNAKIKNK